MRSATIQRETAETRIELRLDLDGQGTADVRTGVGFFDHMLTLLARHAAVDLYVRAEGDLHVDQHHTVEDVGICLGQALAESLGEKRGIRRYGHFTLPMDETLATAAVDLGGRPYLVYRIANRKRRILEFELSLIEEFFRALTVQGRLNLHIEQVYGRDAHHAYESVFKAFARAVRCACDRDPRQQGVPSSKGTI